jgi:putative endopeptidase
MIALPAHTRIWIAAGVTDMRRGFTGLSALLQTTLDHDPLSGHVFVFRGRRGDLIKLLWFDGDGLCVKGRVRNWWTPADLAHFEAATAKLAAQYDTYKPFPDLSVNGKQTLAENIADVAGISAAYDGYQASLAGKPAPAQDGFSGDQQFFIAFAQNWGSKIREAALRQHVMTNPHAPAQYRADTVRNIDAWYAAFNVQPGEKLYLAPPERVRLW